MMFNIKIVTNCNYKCGKRQRTRDDKGFGNLKLWPLLESTKASNALFNYHVFSDDKEHVY